jgi:hypothetical protein
MWSCSSESLLALQVAFSKLDWESESRNAYTRVAWDQGALQAKHDLLAAIGVPGQELAAVHMLPQHARCE